MNPMETFGFNHAAMGLSEGDTMAKLIDHGLHARGLTDDNVQRVETPSAIKIIAEYAINSYLVIRSIYAQIAHCFTFHNERHLQLKGASPAIVVGEQP